MSKSLLKLLSSLLLFFLLFFLYLIIFFDYMIIYYNLTKTSQILLCYAAVGVTNCNLLRFGYIPSLQKTKKCLAVIRTGGVTKFYFVTF